jgi:hypothetical protein
MKTKTVLVYRQKKVNKKDFHPKTLLAFFRYTLLYRGLLNINRLREALMMGIGLAIILLTYILLLVISYQTIIFISEKDEKRCYLIINKSYKHAYSILLFGILVVISLIKLPHINVDNQTISYLLLSSKFISILTLAGSIFFLNKK